MNVRNFILELQKEDPELEVLFVDEQYGNIVVDGVEVITDTALYCKPKKFLVIRGNSGPDFEPDPEAQAKAEAEFQAREEKKKTAFRDWIKKNHENGLKA